MDAKASLSVLDDTQSSPRISNLVLVLDVIFKIASLRVNALRDQRVEFLTFLTLQCRILQRLLESKGLIL